ncbi:MAG: hydrogenase maturation nickel metallochaperone HypA [Clostridiales bacterium]|nr:hydrogenase maturation nickel metallochaperone HypA [Clostridiales bacterium]
MHELGIVMEIFELLDEISNEQGLKSIDTVTLEIGELSGILPDYLNECWKAARLESNYENTKLEIEFVKARGKCSCGTEFELMENGRQCPNCHKSDYEITSGREFTIKQITAL